MLKSKNSKGNPFKVKTLLMPFGRYEGHPPSECPADYLLEVWHRPMIRKYPALEKWIREHWDQLRSLAPQVKIYSKPLGK